MAGKPLSVPLPGFAPELRRERQNRLMGLALLTPAILLAALFLYYPLAFIVQMSFSLANTYLSPAGPPFPLSHHPALVSRDLPNVLVTRQLARLATAATPTYRLP